MKTPPLGPSQLLALGSVLHSLAEQCKVDFLNRAMVALCQEGVAQIPDHNLQEHGLVLCKSAETCSRNEILELKLKLARTEELLEQARAQAERWQKIAVKGPGPEEHAALQAIYDYLDSFGIDLMPLVELGDLIRAHRNAGRNPCAEIELGVHDRQQRGYMPRKVGEGRK